MRHRPNQRQRLLARPWLRLSVCLGVAVVTALGSPGKVAAQSQPTPPASSNGWTNEEPPKADIPLPPPKPLDPPPHWMTNHPKNPGNDRVLGTAPKPTAETAAKLKTYIQGMVDPEANLTLIQNQSRLLMLKETPKRIQIANEGIAEYNFIGKDQLLLMGRGVGTTQMTFWFPDPKDPSKEEILSYYVSVLPDTSEKERLMRSYKALQDEINCALPDSVICLHLVGDKVVVTGQAKDMAQAQKIIQIIRSNAQAPGGGGGRNRQAGNSRLPTDRSTPDHNPNDPTDTQGQPLVPGTETFVVEGVNWLINMITIPGEQTVNLKVTIAEVNRAASRSIGLNFTVLNKQGQGVFAQATGSLATGGQAQQTGLGGAMTAGSCVPVCPGIVVGNGGFNNLPAMIDNGQVNLAISAMRNLNYAKLLAEPTLAVINGHTANFHAGGEYPVPELTSANNNGNTLQGFAFKPYGVNVSFTPYVTDRDRIRLEIDANITALSNITSTSGLGGAQVQGFNARRLRTTVDLRDGQTLAAAGLIQNDWTGEAHRVPLFGDLPVIGRLAGFDHVSAGEQELVILVTPELTHPIDCKTKLPLPGSDMFEPTDIEYYLLGRLESHRNIDFRSPIMTDWQRLRNYRNFETQFIMGPSGYTVP